MMDPEPMYPDMFHPIITSRTRDLSGRARHTARTCQPVRYYFTDFSRSQRYNAESERLAEPLIGLDPKMQPPECNPGQLHDPLPADVFFLGKIIRKEFMEVRVFADTQGVAAELGYDRNTTVWEC